MKEWINDESSAVDIVILPQDNVESLSDDDDDEVQDDDVMIDNGLPNDVCGMLQVLKVFLNGEDNDDEVKDDDNAKEENTECRAES